jgi:hypothetical protein
VLGLVTMEFVLSCRQGESTAAKATPGPSELRESLDPALFDEKHLRRSHHGHAAGSGEEVSHGKASATCCAVHSEVGCAVTLKWRRRRLSCAKTMKTYRTLNVAVGTTKKSAETH